jgi:GxxExxY protein
MELEDLSFQIIRAAIKLHMELGPGLLESAYEKMLGARLAAEGLNVRTQILVSFSFEGEDFNNAYRLDILVEERIALEIKAQAKLIAVNERQLLTYLRIMNLPMGLVLNFGGVQLKDGIRRIYNPRYSADGSSSLLRCSVAPPVL